MGKPLLYIFSLLFLFNGLKAERKIYSSYNQKNDLVQLSSLKKVGETAQRRDLPETYITPEGNFKIHYTLSGADAVDSVGYVIEAGRAAEHAYSILIDSLNFQPPPVDNIDGEQIDIYIIEWSGRYYAQTYLESENRSTSRENDYISYMEIDNDYNDPAYSTRNLEALRVTIAHEFFHMVQLGYNYFQSGDLPGMDYGDTYFLEWSSVWFEEIAYPKINDYWQYVDDFLTYPSNSMWNYNYWYSLGIFLHYISNNYDAFVITDIWEEIKDGYHAIDALDKILQKETNHSLAWHWNRFFQVIYYTGNRYDPVYSLCEDAQFFPELRIDYTNHPIFDKKQDLTASVSPGATRSFQLTFDKSQYVGVDKNSSYQDSLTSGYTIHNQLFNDFSSDFQLYQDTFIGEISSQDTLIVYMTNSTLQRTMDFDFTISEREKPSIATKIINLYPNPIDTRNSDRVSVEVLADARDQNFKLILYDLLGRKVVEEDYTLDRELETSQVYDLRIRPEISSGIYILQCKTKSSSNSKKVTIIH